MNPLSSTPAAAAVPGARSARAPETSFTVLLNLALVITGGAGVF